MEQDEIKAIIEGLLFVAGEEGLSLKQMSDVLNTDEQTVNKALTQLKLDYDSQNRGIDLVYADEHYQLTTKAIHAEYYQKLLKTSRHTTLSQAALETLAIVAYKQPITKAEIDDIRGVQSDAPLRTLVNRQLVQEVGRAESIGRAILYGTTTQFLQAFQFTSLEELPQLSVGTEEESVAEETELSDRPLNPSRSNE